MLRKRLIKASSIALTFIIMILVSLLFSMIIVVLLGNHALDIEQASIASSLGEYHRKITKPVVYGIVNSTGMLIKIINPTDIECYLTKIIEGNKTLWEGNLKIPPHCIKELAIRNNVTSKTHVAVYEGVIAPGDIFNFNVSSNTVTKVSSGVVFWDDFNENTYEELWFDDNIVPVYDPMDLGRPEHYRDEDLRFEDGVLTINTRFYKEHAELRSPLITLNNGYVIVARLRYPGEGYKYPVGFYIGSKREYFGIRFSEKDDKIYLFESSSKESRILMSLDLTNNWYIVVYDCDAKRLILESDDGGEHASSTISMELNDIYLWLGQVGEYKVVVKRELEVKQSPWFDAYDNKVDRTYTFRFPSNLDYVSYVQVYLTATTGEGFRNPSGWFRADGKQKSLGWWGKIGDEYYYGGQYIYINKKVNPLTCRVHASWDNKIWFAYYFHAVYYIKKKVKQPQKEIAQYDYVGVFKSRYITIGGLEENSVIELYDCNGDLISTSYGSYEVKIKLPINYLRVFTGKIVIKYREPLPKPEPPKDITVILRSKKKNEEVNVNWIGYGVQPAIEYPLKETYTSTTINYDYIENKSIIINCTVIEYPAYIEVKDNNTIISISIDETLLSLKINGEETYRAPLKVKDLIIAWDYNGTLIIYLTKNLLTHIKTDKIRGNIQVNHDNVLVWIKIVEDPYITC